MTDYSSIGPGPDIVAALEPLVEAAMITGFLALSEKRDQLTHALAAVDPRSSAADVMKGILGTSVVDFINVRGTLSRSAAGAILATHRPRIIEPGPGQEAAIDALPHETVIRAETTDLAGRIVLERARSGIWCEPGVSVSSTSAEVAAYGYRWTVLHEPQLSDKRTCRGCGCTDDDCTGCIEWTGQPCTWSEADLCSACALTGSARATKIDGEPA